LIIIGVSLRLCVSAARILINQTFLGGLLAAALVLLPAAPGVAGDAAKLEELRRRIEALQQSLNAARGREAAVREEVRDLERRIGALVHGLKDIEERLKADSRRLNDLERRARAAQGELARHRDALAELARSAYASGRHEYLKLLLNQQDPAAAARALAYYRYLNEARLQRVLRLQTSLVEIESLEREIRRRRETLDALREDRIRRKASLEAASGRRGELLAHLKREIRSTSGEIERLRADERRLTELLSGLKTYLSDLPPLPPDAGIRFGELKGRLRLPMQGRVLARYGQQKGIGDLSWRGLFLAASEGEAVRAVYRGRVAYADWLRGFGLLLILEHGDGYMTLYGHTQSLHKQVGDWVETGEIIARAGSTGDAPRPGLYFEVRHQGEPRDPLIWCRAP
jgi:septal ring factor EnvC (AmiA/AmiB activator)